MFAIEVTRTWSYNMSDEVESWTTDPHRTDTETMEYVYADECDNYAGPVDWAVGMLNNDRVVSTPGMCGFPALNPSSSPIGPVARPHEWLSGTATDNYTNEETEWSVYLTSSGWSDEQRAEVFTRASV
jgi:hypothetical protein